MGLLDDCNPFPALEKYNKNIGSFYRKLGSLYAELNQQLRVALGYENEDQFQMHNAFSLLRAYYTGEEKKSQTELAEAFTKLKYYAHLDPQASKNLKIEDAKVRYQIILGYMALDDVSSEYAANVGKVAKALRDLTVVVNLWGSGNLVQNHWSYVHDAFSELSEAAYAKKDIQTLLAMSDCGILQPLRSKLTEMVEKIISDGIKVSDERILDNKRKIATLESCLKDSDSLPESTRELTSICLKKLRKEAYPISASTFLNPKNYARRWGWMKPKPVAQKAAIQQME